MDKPSPSPNPVSRPFREACGREELVYQHCAGCGSAQYYPRSLCTHCSSAALEWRVSTGRGTVYSYTDVFRAPNEAFKADVPYVIAVIDVTEGFRVLTNVLAETGKVKIGSGVHAVFEDRGAVKLLQFALDTQSG
jgi:uncharacterized OB-fold protein